MGVVAPGEKKCVNYCKGFFINCHVNKFIYLSSYIYSCTSFVCVSVAQGNMYQSADTVSLNRLELRVFNSYPKHMS